MFSRQKVYVNKMKSTWIEGTVQAELFKFVWEVNADSLIDKKVGEYLQSPRFFTTNSYNCKQDWKLQLFPKGEEQGDKKMALYLRHNHSRGTTASISFCLISQNNQKVEFCSLKNKFFKRESAWGVRNFASKDFVLDPKNDIVKGGKFKIWCKIDFQELAPQKFESAKRSSESSALEKLFASEKFSDVTVNAQARSFHLHRCVLASSSEVFEAMFEIEPQQCQVEIEGVHHSVLQELFRFIYTGKVCAIEGLVDGLLVVAERYKVRELKALCEEIMVSLIEDSGNMKLATEYFNLAIENEAEELKKGIVEWYYSVMNLRYHIKKEEYDEFGEKYPEVLLKTMKKYIRP